MHRITVQIFEKGGIDAVQHTKRDILSGRAGNRKKAFALFLPCLRKLHLAVLCLLPLWANPSWGVSYTFSEVAFSAARYDTFSNATVNNNGLVAYNFDQSPSSTVGDQRHTPL